MPLKRNQQWAAHDLHPFLMAHENTPFAYGTFDCCLMAADAIQAMTGVDIAPDFRGQYSTELGALKAIKQITGGSTTEDAVAWCAKKHELTEWKGPPFAQRGDLVLVADGDQLIAGIVHLNGKHVVSPGETGLKRLPLAAVKRAWKV